MLKKQIAGRWRAAEERLLRKNRVVPGFSRLAISLAVAATGAGSALPVLAQDAPADTAAGGTLERITVTGSNIKRTDAETPAPVQTITSEQITQSGYTSIGEVLHSITANGQGNLNQAFSGAFAAGASGIALRGLTVNATLVLIDGHRMAPYPIGDDGFRAFVDTSNLPLAVVDRIEVLKDGASAIYGSDAVAGVVNIILKKQFQGITAQAEYGTSYKGDADTAHAALTYGYGDLATQGHNTFVNVEYRNQQSLSQSKRDYLMTNDFRAQGGPGPNGVVPVNASYPFVANLYGMTLPISSTGVVDKTQPVQLPGCANPLPNAGGCAFNSLAYEQIQPATHQTNALLRHTMDFGSGWEAVLTGSVFNLWAEQVNAPQSVGKPRSRNNPGFLTSSAWAVLVPGGTVNTGSPTQQPIVLPIGNPNNPYATSAAWLSYTFGDVGAPHTVTDTNMYRLVADLTGSVAGWDVSFSGGYMRGITDLTYSNYVNYQGLKSLIANGTYLLGANAGQNSAATYQTLAPKTSAIATSALQYVSAEATHELAPLPGGPLTLALGTQYRHEHQDDPGQPGAVAGNIVGFGTTFIHGGDQSAAVYAELNAPVLKNLELDAAIREEAYWGIGKSLAPKIGAKYKPIDMLAIRSTFSKGFRAPSAGERGDSNTSFFVGNGTAGSTPGNPNLVPEKTRANTYGIVLEPVAGNSISVDYYKIVRKNAIANDFNNPITIVPNETPGLPDLVDAFPFIQANEDSVSGLEFDLQSRVKLGPVGTLTTHGTFSHNIHQTTNIGGIVYEFAGTHGPTGISGDTGSPRNRGTLTFAIDQANFGYGLTINYVSGMGNWDTSAGTDPSNLPADCIDPWYSPCKVKSFTYFDLFGHFDVSKQLTLNGHIQNFTNKKAPFDTPSNYGGFNYDPAYAQAGAIGRFFEVGLKYSF